MPRNPHQSSSSLSPRYLGTRLPSWRTYLTGATLLLTTGCSWMPGSAPTEKQVVKSTQAPNNPLNFKILEITPDVADILAAEAPPLVSTIAKEGAAPANDRIGPGDMLTITIFELGNGLFAPTDHALAAASGGDGGGAAPPQVTSQTLPPVLVEGDGCITIPYVGRLRVAGRTPQAVGNLIQSRLRGKSQEPQVMVGIANDVGNTVVVSGEVHKPGRVVLSLAQERLADLVAIAGGALYPPNDTLVQLVRNNKTGMTDLATLESNPHEDIRARPGDRLRVIYQPRSFTAFGAVGQTQQPNEIRFNTATLTLTEALARVGGPSDQRADPNAVYLLRYESPAVAQQLGLDTPATPRGTPVVYHLDLLNTTDYFLAQHVPIKNRDVILIADAATDRFYKVANLVGTFFGPAMSAGLYAR